MTLLEDQTNKEGIHKLNLSFKRTIDVLRDFILEKITRKHKT